MAEESPQVSFVVGPPTARRAALVARYTAIESARWIIGDPEAAASVRNAIAASCPARLDPSVFTVRHLASHLAKRRLARGFELNRPALRELLGELVQNASHRPNEALREFVDSPSAEGYLADSFRRLRLSGLGPREAAGALRAANGSEAGGALARLYADFLEVLDRRRLIDDAGAIEAAIASIDDNAASDLLIIDLPGPTTPLEQELLQHLGATAREVLITLPGPPERFPAAERMRQSWATGFRVNAETLAIDDADNGHPIELQHLRTKVFSDQPNTAPLGPGFRVLAERDAHAAARGLARHAKRLLVQSAKPHEVVIALPSLASESARYAAALAEVGVPHVSSVTPTANRAPRVGALLDLLDVATSDWSFDALVTVLRRRDLFALRDDKPVRGFADRAAAAEWFVRELQVPSGRRYLLRQAESLAGATNKPDDRLALSANAAREVFAALAEVLDRLPFEGTPLEWEAAGGEALRRAGYTALDAARLDSAAIDACENAAGAVEGLHRYVGRALPQWNLAEYASKARSWSRLLRLNLSDPTECAVRLVDVRSALGLTCEHLLIGDANETAFSPTDGDTESDAAMLRFFQLISVPSASLTFAYAERDDAGQPLLPSPYVAEAFRLFADQPTDASPANEPEAASLRDMRQAAVQAALRGEGRPLAEAAARGDRGFLNGLRAVHERVSGNAFGPWEGVLADAAAASELSDRLGPRRLWSATQLETLAACPFKFFANEILELQPPGQMDVSVDYRRRGSLMHDALAIATLDDAPRDGDRAQRLVELIRERVDPSRLPPHESTLAEIEARQASEWSARLPEQQAKYERSKHFAELDGSPTTAAAEFRFGPPTGGGVEDPASTDRCLDLELPSGEVLQVVGRIDRIDTLRDADRVYFSVIDYKTAQNYKVSLDAVREGRQLQPVLYALAAQRLLLGDQAIPVAAGYWVVQNKGFVAPNPKDLPMLDFVDGQPRPSAEWSELVAEVARNTEEIVRTARRGEFPMDHPDEDCGRTCDFRTVCRVAQARSLGRVRPGGAASE